MTSSSSQTPNTADPAARVEDILAELKSRFKASVAALKSAIAAYVHDGTLPPADAASTGLFD
jgi:AMP nucleosidase